MAKTKKELIASFRDMFKALTYLANLDPELAGNTQSRQIQEEEANAIAGKFVDWLTEHVMDEIERENKRRNRS
jgi:hypothetical protein